MAQVNKISSFKSFTEIRKQESVSKLREENNLKRQESVGKIAAILDELGLTSFEGLEEDQKESIISKIFGDVSEEEITEIEVEVEEEIEVVREVFGDNMLICGFYSYGEISPTLNKVACELHNQTMTITLISE